MKGELGIELHVRRDDLLGSLNHVAKFPPLTLLCGAVRIGRTHVKSRAHPVKKVETEWRW